MASKLPPGSEETLRYFDKYDYPLTKEELTQYLSLGLSNTTPHSPPDSGGEERSSGVALTRGLFHLSGRSQIVETRRRREKISQQKWVIARDLGERLKKFPSIKAVYVTGSLAMNNADVDDDVDFMLITAVNTLWISRLIINIYFWAQRRFPGQKQAPDKLCINLWLDESVLHITPHDLYRAHEVLQAKLLWDRDNMHARFLAVNLWVKKFLPNAFPNVQLTMKNVQIPTNFALLIINCAFYLAQLIYMKPKMTSERVSLHSAFFHPQKSS